MVAATAGGPVLSYRLQEGAGATATKTRRPPLPDPYSTPPRSPESCTPARLALM